MTDEEREDAEFRQYLEARFYEGFFLDFDRAVLMGFREGDNETQG